MSKQFDWSKVAPPGGWKERTYYVVNVSFSPSNPEHRAILYTGFWDKKMNKPGGYSNLFQGSYESGKADPDEAYSVRVISEIEDMKNG